MNLIQRNVLRYKRYYRGENGRWSLFHGPADVYVASSFMVDPIYQIVLTLSSVLALPGRLDPVCWSFLGCKMGAR